MYIKILKSMSEVEEDWDPNIFLTLQFSVVGPFLAGSQICPPPAFSFPSW